MEYILFSFVIQICFLMIIIVNSYVITDTTIGLDVKNDTAEFEEIQFVNKTRRSLATNDNAKLWDGGIIPYEIDESYTGQQRKLIRQAMRHWEQSTCLQFVPRTGGIGEHYLLFVKTECGCCSFVGKQSFERQILSMADNCMSFGTILHELGHTIGFFHEHNRPDRDDHVEILQDNIMIGKEGIFDKVSKNESTTLGLAYDYSSVMHYNSNSYAKTFNTDTIKPLMTINGEWPILGQRNYLSRVDIIGTSHLYHCLECGKTLLKPKGIFSPPIQNNSQLIVESCKWTIRAAEGHQIKLSIKSLNIRESLDCLTDYLEIRKGYGKNDESIARYCGKYVTTLTIDSHFVQVVLVRTYVEFNQPAFIIEYEAVCYNDVYIEHNETFYLESPNYPEQYGPNELCYWHISVPEDHFISIKFYHFELQDSPDCKSDFLEIREGDNYQAQINGIYCGKKDNFKLTSIGRLLLLRFITDESINENGFSAIITAQTIHDYN